MYCMHRCVSQNPRTTRALGLKTVIRVYTGRGVYSRQSSRYIKPHQLQRFSPIWTFFHRQYLGMSQSEAGRRTVLPDGVWPTMITPFLDDEGKSVDWKGLDILTEWYIRSGVAGIFSICLSSEMFQLTNEERVEIARRVVEKAAGRVPVVAGATFEGGLQKQAMLMNEMGKHVDAVVIITNQICGMEENDETWIANVQTLMDLTGDIPLGLYETPVPKVRNLTPDMMTWVAKTGRFVFHKDTSLDQITMVNKIRAAKMATDTPLKFFTAKVQFLKTLLDNGGNGFSGVCPNFYPWMVVWMCEHKQESEAKRDKMQRFLSVTDRVIAHKYPTSSKFYLSKFYSMPIKPISRVTNDVLNDQDSLALQCMKEMEEEVCQEFGITPVHPTVQE